MTLARFSRIRARASELYTFLRGAAPGKPASGVLIFAQGRTGSTLLESLLASTGYFVAGGEVLSRPGTRIRRPATYLHGLARRTAGRQFLCHVKIYHLVRDREEDGRPAVFPRRFLEALTLRGWKIVYLRRADRVRHALSNITAEATGTFHAVSTVAATPVHVSRERLVELVVERARFEAEEAIALDGITFHEVVYERDLENPGNHQRTVDGILEFLELPSRTAATPLRKINGRPLAEIVANPAEFTNWAAELQGTNHTCFNATA